MDYFLTDALPFLYGSTTLQQTAIWNSDRNPEQLAALHSAIATKQLGGIVGLCTFHLLRLNAMESGNRGCATDEQMRPIIAAWQRIATELESQEEALDQHDAILEHVTTEVNTGRMDAETASRITAFAHSIAGLWPQWALYARLTSFTLGANTTSNNESRSCRRCCFFFFFFFFLCFFVASPVLLRCVTPLAFVTACWLTSTGLNAVQVGAGLDGHLMPHRVLQISSEAVTNRLAEIGKEAERLVNTKPVNTPRVRSFV